MKLLLNGTETFQMKRGKNYNVSLCLMWVKSQSPFGDPLKDRAGDKTLTKKLLEVTVLK